MKKLALAVLCAAFLALPSRASAQTTTGTHWTRCVLHYDWPTATRIVHKVCTKYPMPREHRHQPSWGHMLISDRLTSGHHLRVRIWWPRWYQPRPPETFRLPGCPPSIARWAAYIIPAARANGLPVPLLTGVMWNESKGDPNAYNPSSGAKGLYQFIPSTAAAMGINPWDPAQSTAAAAAYIRKNGLVSFSGGGYGSAWGCD